MLKQDALNPDGEAGLERLVEAAYLYYSEGRTQQEIATRLRISRPWVSRLLRRARDLGIVRIELSPAFVRSVELSERLKAALGIKEAVVARHHGSGGEDDTALVAGVAADYIISTVEPSARIGVAWGKTLYQTVRSIRSPRHLGVSVIPVMGGLGPHHPEIQGNYVAITLAERFGGDAYCVHAPAYASSREERDMFLNMPAISQIWGGLDSLDLVLVGIGALSGSTVFEMGYIENNDLETLRSAGSVGNVGPWFLDERGGILPGVVNERLVALPVERVRRIAKRIIAVAAGGHKVNAIMSAISGGWLDGLITGEVTARRLLESASALPAART